MLEKLKEAPGKLANFYGDVKVELKKVTWPGKKEVSGTTMVVILAVFFFGIYLFLVDLFLKFVVQRVVDYFQ